MPLMKFLTPNPLLFKRLLTLVLLLIAVAFVATNPSLFSKIGQGFQAESETDQDKNQDQNQTKDVALKNTSDEPSSSDEVMDEYYEDWEETEEERLNPVSPSISINDPLQPLLSRLPLQFLLPAIPWSCPLLLSQVTLV